MKNHSSQANLTIFIDGISNYLSMNLGGDKFTVSSPLEIKPGDCPAKEITGIVGISGIKKGCVYFTANKPLIQRVLENMGEEDLEDDESLKDLVGEIANTIAGNVGTHFGKEFQMSVPVVVSGKLDNIYLPKCSNAFVIEALWKNQASNLVICID